jgi:aminoglycoside phosphotransferase (APT) family kinase protein
MTSDLSSLPIPDSLDEITDDWLSVVMGAAVVRRGVEPLSVGTTGRVYRLTVGGDGAAGQSLIVKLPAEDLDQRAYYDARGFYLQEASFYRLLAPEAPIGTPRAYFARADGSPRRMAIVLEDLTASGYTLGNQLGGATADASVAAVRALAKLHARWWGDRSLDEHDWLPRPNEWPHVEELASTWRAWPAEFRASLDRDTVRTIDLMLDRLDALHEQASTGELTVVHGDFRFDNLCVNADGEIAAFDWQLVARAPGARDLAFFAGLTEVSDVEADEAWRLLVDAYLDELRELGIEYRRDVLEEDLRLNAFYFFRVAVGAIGAMDLTDERNRRLASYIVGRLALIEHRLALGEFLEREFPA